MTQMELILRGLELKMDRLIDLYTDNQTEKININKINEIEGEWISLREAAVMKGTYSVKTVAARPDLQPCLGHGFRSGRKKFFRKIDVLEWLSVLTPDQYKAYQAKYKQEGAS